MENEMTVEQKMMQAVKHLIEGAKYFSAAGFIKTSEQLLNFTLEVATQMANEEEKLEQFKNKLTDSEYDDILADILNVEIEDVEIGK